MTWDHQNISKGGCLSAYVGGPPFSYDGPYLPLMAKAV